jgi:hypothetical protein
MLRPTISFEYNHLINTRTADVPFESSQRLNSYSGKLNRMRTVDLIDQVVAQAQRAGIQVRYEDLEGRGTALCSIRGQRCLFIDLTQSCEERWEQLKTILAGETWLQPLLQQIAQQNERMPS